MVCSPKVNMMITPKDEDLLSRKIKDAIENKNTEIYTSETPPTLRSCILYEKGKPVMCCLQHYVITMLEDTLPRFKGRHAPCVMIYDSDDDFLMQQYVGFCESEFERLVLHEDAYIPVVKNDEIERLEMQKPELNEMRRFFNERREKRDENRTGSSMWEISGVS